jgi:hypothetical protein
MPCVLFPPAVETESAAVPLQKGVAFCFAFRSSRLYVPSAVVRAACPSPDTVIQGLFGTVTIGKGSISIFVFSNNEMGLQESGSLRFGLHLS